MKSRFLRWGLALAALFCLLGQSAAHGAQSPEVSRGIAWLKTQIEADKTVTGESGSMAQIMQVRCEVSTTLLYFQLYYNLPRCLPQGVTLTEIATRNSDYAQLTAGYWTAEGGVMSDDGFGSASVIDTAWSLSQKNLTAAQAAGVIGYLFKYQDSSGGFSAGDAGPVSVAATALIGRHLSLRKELTGPQSQMLDKAAEWVQSQAVGPGVWNSTYETAMAHLFLLLQAPDPARDAATYEYFARTQLGNGSWENDPFLTALVLRAADSRSTPKTVESGYKLRVIDRDTRAPVPGVSVAGATSTDLNGLAEVKTASQNGLNVSLYKSGYQSNALTVSIPDGEVVDLGDIEMLPVVTSVQLFGDVVDANTKAPVQSVSVSVYADGTWAGFSTTNAGGHYETGVTKGGALVVKFTGAGYLSREISFSGEVGKSYQVDAALVPSAAIKDGVIQGRVVDRATGLPIRSAYIVWRTLSGSTTLVTFSASDGSYIFSGLVREEGTLSISATGYSGKVVTGLVPEAVAVDFNLALDKNATQPTTARVLGVVKDIQTQAVLKNVTVEFINKSSSSSAGVAVSDAEGKFIFDALPFAAYKVVGKLSGYDVLNGEIQPSSTYSQINLSLMMQQSLGGLSGRVIDKATRAPVENAQIKAGAQTARTNAAGEFLLTGIPSSAYTIEASATGYTGAALSALIVSGQVTTTGDIELIALPENPLFGELAGTITDRASKTPIQGASISVAQTLIAGVTDKAGDYLLQNIPLGSHDVRVVAPGYLPTTLRADIAESRRYRLDASLTKVATNSVAIAISTDAASYGAYSTIKLTTNYTVSSAVSQYGYLEFFVMNSSGSVVKSLPELSSGWTNPIYLASSIKTLLTSFTTDNLPPGEYRIEAALYDSNGGSARSDRVMLATATTSFSIVGTQKIESINVVPLPAYANYNVPVQTGYRVEVVNKSNIDSDFDVSLALTGPSGATVGAVTQSIHIRGDEKFRAFDIPYGSIAFNPHGRYLSSATLTGISMPTVTLGAINVMPGLRIEVDKQIQPDVIPPGADHKLKINIRIKGVEQ